MLINFNIWLPLALTAAPFIFIQCFVRKQPISRQSFLRNLTASAPLYLWLGIFTLQPHKEERFMYPAYPLLALNAAISLHGILQIVGHTNPKSSFRVQPFLKLAATTSLIILAIVISFLRTAGLATGYTAPLKVYSPLQQYAIPGNTVCLGKEWYRFPSSYFLPNGTKAKFVKSAFSGLLPGEFSVAKTGFGLFPGTWLIPVGMNDENNEDPGKYVSKYTE
jgi:alpha-1,2-mannosyltransferase